MGSARNSFVIHPMLQDVVEVCGEDVTAWREMRPRILERARRHAAILETAGRARRQLSSGWPVDRLSLRRVPPAGAAGAATRAARSRVVAPGPRGARRAE